jgi:hypothetical protein
MTNYSNFPKWRKYGIVMKFNDHQYSWCENSKANRKYLIESKYCSDGIEFYVWENDITHTNIETFKEYLKEKQNNKSDEICPSCSGKLVTRINRTNGEHFIGCKNYPDCQYT